VLTRRGFRAQSDAPVVATQPEASPAVARRARTPRKLIGDAGRARSKGAAAKKKKPVALAPAPVEAEAPAVAPAEAEAEAEVEEGVAEAEVVEAVAPDAAGAAVGGDAPPPAARPAARGAYRFTAADVDGTPHPLAEFAGKVTVIVNVASACGYTATNYAGLQELQTEFEARGFSVLAFPCNCFGAQEPGSPAAVASFAKSRGATFPVFEKIAAVNGDDAPPLYQWLHLQPGHDADFEWNFVKLLVGRNGQLLKRYGPAFDGDALRRDIEDALKQAYDEADAF
jgi:glutathione peroxidase